MNIVIIIRASPWTIKSLFISLEQAKALMHYEDLRCEALAWGELKDKLGHFAAPRDKARYMRKAIELLNEIADRIDDELN